MAIIPGQIEDEIVVIGNHNDACKLPKLVVGKPFIPKNRYLTKVFSELQSYPGTFGAGDPNSGTSSMHETVRGFSELMKLGWKPFRTILLASWDAEEYVSSFPLFFLLLPLPLADVLSVCRYGLIGSTEFGEDFTDYLRSRVVAYLNLDVSAYSLSLSLSSPLLSLEELMDRLRKCRCFWIQF